MAHNWFITTEQEVFVMCKNLTFASMIHVYGTMSGVVCVGNTTGMHLAMKVYCVGASPHMFALLNGCRAQTRE